MVICLERGVYDLHMVQLMPLPPHHLLLHYNSEWFNLSGTGLVGYPRYPGKESIKRVSFCLSVCLKVICLLIFILYLL